LSEFQRDLNEFVLWLEEADNIAITPLGDEQQLKEQLEQVKVISLIKILRAYLYKAHINLF
jgi:dystrophin